MEFLNIGPLELIIFLILAFILLGPKEMVLTANRIGKWIRSFVRSPMWREIMGYSQEIRNLPTKIMDETGLKEELESVQKTTKDAVKDVNQSINEAAKAAVVPEAQHIKLQTEPEKPAVSTTKKAEADKKAQSEVVEEQAENAVEVGEEFAAVAESAEGEVIPEASAAVLEQSTLQATSVESQPLDAEPAIVQVAVEEVKPAGLNGTVNHEKSEPEAAPAVVPVEPVSSEDENVQPRPTGDVPVEEKKPRKRAAPRKPKVADPEQSATSAVVSDRRAEDSADAPVEEKKPRKAAAPRKRKVVEPDQPAAESAAETTVPASEAPVEEKKPRKSTTPRKRKVKETEQPAEISELPSNVSDVETGGASAAASVAPVEAKKPRKITPRRRKPVEPEASVEVSAPAPEASQDAAPGDPSTAEAGQVLVVETPVKKPRKPRKSKIQVYDSETPAEENLPEVNNQAGD